MFLVQGAAEKPVGFQYNGTQNRQLFLPHPVLGGT